MYILEILFAATVASLCADVDAKVKRVVKFDGPKRVYEPVVFKVGCGGSKCKIDNVTIEQSGHLYLALNNKPRNVGRFGYIPNSWSNKTLDEKEFFISVYGWSWSGGANIAVELGNSEISIKKLNGEGAWVFFDPQTQENSVQIQTGFLESKLFYHEKQIHVMCNGKCKGLKFELKSIVDGGVKLVMSEDEPVFVSDNGTYNSICESKTPGRGCPVSGSKEKCRDGEKEEFSLNSSVVFLTLIPNPKVKDATAILTGRNIREIYAFQPFGGGQGYRSSDGSSVKLRSIKGPLTEGKYVHLKVYCERKGFCKNVSIVVIPKETVLMVRAGKNTETTPCGHCPGCDCNGVESCATRFDPKGAFGHRYFFITLKLQPIEDHNLRYVKVSGDNLYAVRNAYLPYDEKSSIKYP